MNISSSLIQLLRHLCENSELFHLVATYQVHSHSNLVENIRMKGAVIILECFLLIAL